MGSWGITMRQSDYGLDLLGTIVDTQLKTVDFSSFSVADALEVIKADIMEEIRRANHGCSAEDLVFYFSENFSRNFTQGALLVAECLADFYRTGELVVYEYVGKNYDPVEHRIKEFVVLIGQKPAEPLYGLIVPLFGPKAPLPVVPGGLVQLGNKGLIDTGIFHLDCHNI